MVVMHALLLFQVVIYARRMVGLQNVLNVILLMDTKFLEQLAVIPTTNNTPMEMMAVLLAQK